VAIVAWLWTGTAIQPEKESKDVGLGLRLPLYRSGPRSVGWWAMFITMLGDATAFVALVFGYFFFWTVHAQFPPPEAPPIGAGWPLAAGALGLGSWAATLLARRWNALDRGAAFHGASALAVLLAGGAVLALVETPRAAGLEPTRHAYDAIVWLLVAWTALHVAVGAFMQLYCIARRLAGRMTARHDIDVQNVSLYWHFVGGTVAVTLAVVAGVPELA
jgi:cytochrome c oxidase subunit I+III